MLEVPALGGCLSTMLKWLRENKREWDFGKKVIFLDMAPVSEVEGVVFSRFDGVHWYISQYEECGSCTLLLEKTVFCSGILPTAFGSHLSFSLETTDLICTTVTLKLVYCDTLYVVLSLKTIWKLQLAEIVDALLLSGPSCGNILLLLYSHCTDSLHVSESNSKCSCKPLYFFSNWGTKTISSGMNLCGNCALYNVCVNV